MYLHFFLILVQCIKFTKPVLSKSTCCGFQLNGQTFVYSTCYGETRKSFLTQIPSIGLSGQGRTRWAASTFPMKCPKQEQGGKFYRWMFGFVALTWVFYLSEQEESCFFCPVETNKLNAPSFGFLLFIFIWMLRSRSGWNWSAWCRTTRTRSWCPVCRVSSAQTRRRDMWETTSAVVLCTLICCLIKPTESFLSWIHRLKHKTFQH